MNVFFLLASVFVLWKVFLGNQQVRASLQTPLTLILVVLGISVLQALVEYGENSRYYIPNQTVVIVLVVYFLPTIWQELSARLSSIKVSPVHNKC